MKLDQRSVQSIRPAKIFNESRDEINHISFSRDGESIITSGDDDQVSIYDCNNGIFKKSFNSRKYGVNLIQFTHADNTVIHASTKVDNSVRYLSLNSNQYIRYFSGHTDRVVALRMSPLDDLFISGSIDHTMRIWDLKSPNCQGMLTVPGVPVSSIDPEGLIFTVGYDSTLKFYDLRSYDKGPFLTSEIDQNSVKCDWSDLRFSPDGKNLLISTTGKSHLLVDAFYGTLRHRFEGFSNDVGLHIAADFTPDSQFVISGSSDGFIHFWKTESGEKVTQIKSVFPNGCIRHVRFNPRLMLLAAASSQLGLFLPYLDDD